EPDPGRGESGRRIGRPRRQAPPAAGGGLQQPHRAHPRRPHPGGRQPLISITPRRGVMRRHQHWMRLTTLCCLLSLLAAPARPVRADDSQPPVTTADDGGPTSDGSAGAPDQPDGNTATKTPTGCVNASGIQLTNNNPQFIGDFQTVTSTVT